MELTNDYSSLTHQEQGEEVEAPLLLNNECDDDFDEPQNQEILPNFVPLGCSSCGLIRLEVLGGYLDKVMCRCASCGRLTFIQINQPQSIQSQPKKEILGVG